MNGVEDAQQLSEVLDQLRATGGDHQWVEAKRSRRGLPAQLWTSLSAFANSEYGGLVLLGVDEGNGSFEITGVEDPAALSAALQSACALLDPELRPAIHVVQSNDGAVLTARIEPVPAARRPCHRPDKGAHASAYVRVGDADQLMSHAEVDDLLAAREGTDHSRRPAPDDAVLDGSTVARFVQATRSRSERNVGIEDQEVLRRYGAVDDAGRPTLAGVLTLGDAPEQWLPAARVALRRPAEGGRFDGSHAEGTIGELLDQCMAWLHRTLTASQMEQSDGHLVDSLDVPPIALRELLVNALLHRSLTEAQDTTSVAVEVTTRTVTITSPGGLHPGTDMTSLGLRPLSSPRNPALVRISELLTTPSGARVSENQASGIATADAACRRAGTMPALLVSGPARFDAVLPRHRLDRRQGGGDPTADRLVAVATTLEQLREDDAGSVVSGVRLDTTLAARALETSPDRAAVALDLAVRQRRLDRRRGPGRPVWVPLVDDGMREGHPRLPLLLAALAGAPSPLGTRDLLGPLQVSSNRTVTAVVRDAMERGLVEPTTDSPHDPTRAYRLTEDGRHAVDRT